jgi:hypothetical protein
MHSLSLLFKKKLVYIPFTDDFSVFSLPLSGELCKIFKNKILEIAGYSGEIFFLKILQISWLYED